MRYQVLCIPIFHDSHLIHFPICSQFLRTSPIFSAKGSPPPTYECREPRRLVDTSNCTSAVVWLHHHDAPDIPFLPPTSPNLYCCSTRIGFDTPKHSLIMAAVVADKGNAATSVYNPYRIFLAAQRSMGDPSVVAKVLVELLGDCAGHDVLMGSAASVLDMYYGARGARLSAMTDFGKFAGELADELGKRDSPEVRKASNKYKYSSTSMAVLSPLVHTKYIHVIALVVMVRLRLLGCNPRGVRGHPHGARGTWSALGSPTSQVPAL